MVFLPVAVLLNLVFVHLGHLPLILLADRYEAWLGLQVVVVDDRLAGELSLVAVVEALDLEDLVAAPTHAILFRIADFFTGNSGFFVARLLILGVLDEHLVALLLDLVEELLRVAPDLG